MCTIFHAVAATTVCYDRAALLRRQEDPACARWLSAVAHKGMRSATHNTVLTCSPAQRSSVVCRDTNDVMSFPISCTCDKHPTFGYKHFVSFAAVVHALAPRV
jgi:hypothetical protein